MRNNESHSLLLTHTRLCSSSHAVTSSLWCFLLKLRLKRLLTLLCQRDGKCNQPTLFSVAVMKDMTALSKSLFLLQKYINCIRGLTVSSHACFYIKRTDNFAFIWLIKHFLVSFFVSSFQVYIFLPPKGSLKQLTSPFQKQHQKE